MKRFLQCQAMETSAVGCAPQCAVQVAINERVKRYPDRPVVIMAVRVKQTPPQHSGDLGLPYLLCQTTQACMSPSVVETCDIHSATEIESLIALLLALLKATRFRAAERERVDHRRV